MNIDYGCQCTFIYVTNPEFAKRMQDDVLGTVYSPPSTFPGVRPFTVGLLIENQSRALELARILQGWCDSDAQGNGIFLALLRNNKGYYRIQLGPDISQIMRRLTNVYTSRLLKPHVLGMFHSKASDDESGGPSRNAPLFLRRWSGKPVRLTTFINGESYPLEVPGTRIENVPLHVYDTEENIYLPVEGKVRSEVQNETDHSADAVASRRTFALRRYFPVTLTRLACAPEFTALAERLQEEGFLDWQILQAACNLTLRGRLQDHAEARFALNQRDDVGVIQALERHPESVLQAPPKLKLIRLRNQMLGDMRDFHQKVTREQGLPSAQIQKWLQSSDFRDNDLHVQTSSAWSFE